MTMQEWIKLIETYNRPSDYQVKKIRELVDQGIIDKWEVEKVINTPTSNNPIIIDFIEYEINMYIKEKNND